MALHQSQEKDQTLQTLRGVIDSGTFTFSELSNLMDKKLEPILHKLEIVDRAIGLEN